MKRGKFRQPRINIVGVGVPLLIIACAACAIAGMTDSSVTPLDQINSLAAQARSAGNRVQVLGTRLPLDLRR